MSKNDFYLCEAAKGGLMVMNSIGIRPVKNVLHTGSLREIRDYLDLEKDIKVTVGGLKKELYTIGYWINNSKS
jgi:hypothetical protein